MIYDRFNALERYRGMHENLDAAIDFLLSHELQALPEGRTEVAGDAVYLNKMSIATKTEGRFEMHRRYADIHIVLSGCERAEVAERVGKELVPFDEAKDCGFWEAETRAVCRLEPGSFLLNPPGEPHKPGLAADGVSAPLVKCCVKVRM